MNLLLYNGFIEKNDNVSRETLQKIADFVDLLLLWNKKLNLISKNTVADIYDRHILDSLQLMQYIGSREQKILDLGTGAGLPGMVLHIAGYRNMTLVESIKKKCLFLSEVKERLALTTEIINARIEDLKPMKCDIITARAVAPLDKLLGLIYAHCNKNSKILFLKGRNYRAEIENAQNLWSFNYKSYKSITSDESVILEITNVAKIKK